MGAGSDEHEDVFLPDPAPAYRDVRRGALLTVVIVAVVDVGFAAGKPIGDVWTVVLVNVALLVSWLLTLIGALCVRASCVVVTTDRVVVAMRPMPAREFARSSIALAVDACAEVAGLRWIELLVLLDARDRRLLKLTARYWPGPERSRLLGALQVPVERHEVIPARDLRRAHKAAIGRWLSYPARFAAAIPAAVLVIAVVVAVIGRTSGASPH